MVIHNVAFVEPPELVAVTIYEVAPCTPVGVPDMTPLFTFNVMPDGNAGLTEYVIPDPVTVGVLFEIATPFV